MDKKDIYDSGEGGYVFISHSHLDIGKVRIIRNTLEENGYEPLCFYLKCLSDDDEVEGLIKREIDSRDIFLYVDSPNSRNSKWVGKEREYINTCHDKTIYTINLDETENVKKETLNILDRTRVFISHSHKDQEAFEIIKNKLISKDFRVFDTTKIKAGESFYDSVTGMIKTACEKGCYLILVSKESIQSKSVAAELLIAFRLGASIIPVYLGDVDITNSELEYFLVVYNWFMLNDINDEERLDELVANIKNVLANKKIV